jgi:YD repeat-containing protein
LKQVIACEDLSPELGWPYDTSPLQTGSGTRPLTPASDARDTVVHGVRLLRDAVAYAFGPRGGHVSASTEQDETRSYKRSTDIARLIRSSQKLESIGINQARQVATEMRNNVGDASVLITDEAGKWRRSTTDALGRSIEVDEPNSTSATVSDCPGQSDPIWVTTYAYDALDNLTSIIQGGSRNRSFTYNSLKQLLQSANPETGTICYGQEASGSCQNNGYDADGNLVYKTDARGVTISYSYDTVNRLTSKAYSNGDPSVSYVYSGTSCLGLSVCYNVGHRTSMTDAGGTEYWLYSRICG